MNKINFKHKSTMETKKKYYVEPLTEVIVTELEGTLLVESLGGGESQGGEGEGD